METRANYFIVGTFSLLLLFAGAGFVIWLNARGDNVRMAEYDIYFSESVRGLSVTSDVLFSGIRVGKVTEIKISPVVPGEVRVRISVAADTPVREDSIARTEMRGITGISVVTISGGTPNSPLKQISEYTVGSISSEPSHIASVVNQVPDLLATLHLVIQRTERVFSDRNIEKIAEIIDSFTVVSKVLADRAETIGLIIDHSEGVVRNLDLLTSNVNEALVTDVKSITRAISSIALRIDKALGIVEPGFAQFGSRALPELQILMVEMRTLVNALTRISQKLENDPGRFLFGEPVKEHKSR